MLPPFVAEFDLGLVEPDIVAAFFQISVNAADEFLVGIVAVAEEDAERGDGSFGQDMATILANVSAALLAEDDVC